MRYLRLLVGERAVQTNEYNGLKYFHNFQLTTNSTVYNVCGVF